MSEATWNAAQRIPWKAPLRVLMLVTVLGLCAGPQALAQDLEEGFQLTPDYNKDDPRTTARRHDCRGAFCVWSVSENLGPCSSDRCVLDWLYVTDRENQVLSMLHGPVTMPRTLFGVSTVDVRFTGTHQLEILNQTQPYHCGAYVDYGPGTDIGVDQSHVTREVWNLSADGKRSTRARNAPRHPAWKRQALVAPVLPQALPRWSLQTPVSEELLARARPLCGEEARIPLHHECHTGTCVLVLKTPPESPEPEPRFDPLKPEEDVDKACLLLVKGSQMSRLGEDAVLHLEDTVYVFIERDGIYGSLGSHRLLSRTQPEHMVFAKTEGRHVEGSNPYPVRQATSVKAARALAPTVHAYTRAHISWGRGGWSGEKDLALAWQLMRVGDSVRLYAEVDDDVLVPFTVGTGVNSDHLELSVGTASGRKKLGVLLGPKGQLQVRLWQRQDMGQEAQDLEEPFPGARGTWHPRAGGYAVDLELPLDALRNPASPQSSGLTVLASDADGAHKQETLMGHTGILRWWTEYPPSIEEYRCD